MKASRRCCRYCGVSYREAPHKYICNCSGVEIDENTLDEDASECPEWHLAETPVNLRPIEDDDGNPIPEDECNKMYRDAMYDAYKAISEFIDSIKDKHQEKNTMACVAFDVLWNAMTETYYEETGAE